MKIPVRRALRHTGQWLAKKFAATAFVLVYHRIADLTADPQRLCVKPENFAAHLDILKSRCTPLSLEALVQRAQNGTLPGHAIAVTFDDGFADNFLNAKPLAERYGVPITVFVAAGQVGSDHEFWWDELERILLRETTLPETLMISIDGRKLAWDLGAVNGNQPDLLNSWHVQCAGDPTPRHAAYRSLCEILRPLSEPKRRSVLEQLRSWSGVTQTHRNTHLALTADQLIMLDRSESVAIGAHTITHPHLSSLPAVDQDAEISGSKAALEEMLGHEISAFAYPFGARGDYNESSMTAVRNAGFDVACANFPGIVWRRSDRFQLPRLIVRDSDGASFERWLDAWLR